MSRAASIVDTWASKRPGTGLAALRELRPEPLHRVHLARGVRRGVSREVPVEDLVGDAVHGRALADPAWVEADHVVGPGHGGAEVDVARGSRSQTRLGPPG